MNQHAARVGVLLALWPVASAFAHHDAEARSAAVAFAVPVQGIKIDGQLDDWPKSMVQYPLLSRLAPYGQTDLTAKDLRDNDDLTAHFMVGYDPAEQLIYVAVVAKDEDHVPANPVKGADESECDACEIFLDGLHAERHNQWYESELPAWLAAIQYVRTGGPGPAYLKDEPFNPEGDNPAMYGADIKKTRSRCEWSRKDNKTIYEWAVQAYDRYPNLTKIEAGKRIGFDVIVADLDHHDGKITDHASWVLFGYPAPQKMNNASTMADLVFLASADELNIVEGQIKDRSGNGLQDGVRVEFCVGGRPRWRGKVPMGEAIADRSGHFTIGLPPGPYAILTAPTQNVGPEDATLEVKAGKPAGLSLTVTPINDPKVFTPALLAKLAELTKAIEDDRPRQALALLNEFPALATARDDHKTPIIISAAGAGQAEIVEALIRAGADPNALGSQKTTALHTAAWNGHADVVRLLIQNKGEINAIEVEHGCTPLLWAVHGYGHSNPRRDQVGCAKALIDAGASAKAKNSSGESGLKMITSEANDPMRKLLMEHGAQE